MNKLPKGCDQQGRHPEAAEAATEVGVDDDGLEAVGEVALLAVVIIVTVAVISLLAGYYS